MDATTDTEITIARAFGKPWAETHYAVPVGEEYPYIYRRICDEGEMDAMAYASESAYPSCRRCQKLDEPQTYRSFEQTARELANQMGYGKAPGGGGGWIYRRGATRPVCQGWHEWARLCAPGRIVQVPGSCRWMILPRSKGSA